MVTNEWCISVDLLDQKSKSLLFPGSGGAVVTIYDRCITFKENKSADPGVGVYGY